MALFNNLQLCFLVDKMFKLTDLSKTFTQNSCINKSFQPISRADDPCKSEVYGRIGFDKYQKHFISHLLIKERTRLLKAGLQ